MTLPRRCVTSQKTAPKETRASPVTEKSQSVFATENSVTELENFLHTGIKLERSRLVNLGNRTEISHMNSNRVKISAR